MSNEKFYGEKTAQKECISHPGPERVYWLGQWWIQNFPDSKSPTSEFGMEPIGKIFVGKKLHENERNWTEVGACQ